MFDPCLGHRLLVSHQRSGVFRKSKSTLSQREAWRIFLNSATSSFRSFSVSRFLIDQFKRNGLLVRWLSLWAEVLPSDLIDWPIVSDISKYLKQVYAPQYLQKENQGNVVPQCLTLTFQPHRWNQGRISRNLYFHFNFSSRLIPGYFELPSIVIALLFDR